MPSFVKPQCCVPPMPSISSMFTKQVAIPATSSGGKGCIEIVNETFITFFGLIFR